MEDNQFKKCMDMVLYQADEGDVSVEAYIKDETLWISQKAMADLFDIDKSGISCHLKSIFASGELDENVVVAKITTTTQHGAIAGKTQRSETNFYNLDAVISVGYWVNSKKATLLLFYIPKFVDFRYNSYSKICLHNHDIIF